MTVHIAYDPELNIAILVSADDLPVALGPIAQGLEGTDPRDVLQSFVDQIDVDPSEVSTWKLWSEWNGFIAWIDRMTEGELERLAAEGDDGAPRNPPDSSQEPLGGLTSVGSGEESPDGAEGAHDAGDEPTDGELADLSDRIHAVGSGPAAPARERCWMCVTEPGRIHGPNGMVDCPVCHGTAMIAVGEA